MKIQIMGANYIPFICYPKVKVYKSRGELFFIKQNLIFGLVFSWPAVLYYKDFAATFFLSSCLVRRISYRMLFCNQKTEKGRHARSNHVMFSIDFVSKRKH